ncbi:MAG: polyprenyl synthetase family protein [Candidatus Aerophobus sp.]|nr:MAG: polyprenyl synthetase family protein [Candidatus Aerophobus sp.]
MNLEQIYAPIKGELQMVEEELRRKLCSNSELVHRLNEYILNVPGKLLRPALLLFSARVSNCQNSHVIPLAAVVEMVHTATLIHDDIVDKSDLRRGQPTINSRWGNGISIVLGDHWYSRAFSSLSRLGVPQILEMLLEVIETICVGELEQLKHRYDPSFGEREYLEVVQKKTASLMSFCCRAGGLIGKAPPKEIDSLANYGLNLGIAFQIVDDCLDLVGTEERAGKSLGSDLLEGKLTLPLIATRARANKKDRELIRHTFNSKKIGAGRLNQMKGLVKRYGGIEYALGKAEEYRDISKEELRSLKKFEPRDSLSLLADYVVKRGY